MQHEQYLQNQYQLDKKRIEVTADELEKLMSDDKLSVIFVDLRNEEACDYGMIPKATHIAPKHLQNYFEEWKQLDLVILYCQKGEVSYNEALRLKEQDICACSLQGGYAEWVLWDIKHRRLEDVERGLRKEFHKKLFTPFAKAINQYELLQPNDKVAVCISGGKDSMLMAKLFQELKRHDKFPFELEFLVMDPGYSQINRKVIENNAALLGIPVHIFESDIFDSVDHIEKNPCYICARMRRGFLYYEAQKLGCNKIALGHHYDDVIETILMGMLYGAQIQTMMPKLHSTNFDGMELIRPMYLIRENDIKRWRDFYGLHFIQCACHFTDTCSIIDPEGHSPSKRMEVKHLIAEMKKSNPFVEGNIFKSVENVNLKTLIAYKCDGKKHLFLEDYE